MTKFVKKPKIDKTKIKLIMDKKQKNLLVVLLVFVVAVLSGLFVWPDYFNAGIAALNSRTGWLRIPSFPTRPFHLGLDLQGGVHILYEADLSGIEDKDKSSSLEGLRDVIERRVNLFGVREPVVQAQQKPGSYRLIVELPGVADPSQAIELIGKTPFLEFKEQRRASSTQEILDKQKELQGKTPEEIEKIENWQLALEDPYFQSTRLTGKYLKRAEIGFDRTTSQPLIFLQFDEEGSKIFEELTSRNVSKPLAIYIDNILISSPIVQEAISGGRAQISGQFTIASAKELVRNLNAGALPVPIKIISRQSVGPTLGAVSLRESLKAGLIGFLAVIIFMLVFYRVPGFLASLSLIIYIGLVLALFKLIPITLTLAGIGGFILSIGMAIDANILIFSRLREEMKEGRNFPLALQEGFRRAWPSIRDGNLTTLIITLILFSFGTSFVKGFAMTLGLGILLSMLTAMVITRVLLKLFEGTKLEEIRWLWQ